MAAGPVAERNQGKAKISHFLCTTSIKNPEFVLKHGFGPHVTGTKNDGFPYQLFKIDGFLGTHDKATE